MPASISALLISAPREPRLVDVSSVSLMKILPSVGRPVIVMAASASPESTSEKLKSVCAKVLSVSSLVVTVAAPPETIGALFPGSGTVIVNVMVAVVVAPLPSEIL